MSYTPFVSDDQLTAESLAKRFDNIVAQLNAYVSPIPSGAVASVSKTTAPDGWLQCDGSAVSRATYAALFAAIGTTFGVGDGSTTFNLPDLRGRAAIGSGTGAGLTARTTGQSLGVETHIIQIAEMPDHTHTSSASATGSGGSAAGATNGLGSGTPQTGSAGSNVAHNNMQPSLALMWIIKI